MSKGMVSAADLSTSEFLVIQQDSDGLADLATSATQDIKGALKDGGKESGEPVALFDVKDTAAYVKLGGTVNEGDRLTSDANSKAVATTTATDQVFGRADQAGVLNDVIQYEPIPGGFGA